MTDQDIMVSVLTTDQISAMDQMSLPFGSLDDNLSATFDITPLSGNMDWMISDANLSALDFSSVNLGSPITVQGSDWKLGNDNVRVDTGGRISLAGKDADIEINGVSLSSRLDGIEQRLAILRPNPDLEQQWDQLRELGDRYRQMEQELQEKTKAWDVLKSMPPPPVP